MFIVTLPLLSTKSEVATTPVEVAGNVADSFVNTTDIPSKFITGVILTKSEYSPPNESDPVKA